MPGLDNRTVATILEVMADLLEMSGADKFRFLSYRKAAHAIRAWPEQVGKLADEERLTEIPGVGAKLSRSIGELLHTGTFAEYEAAKAELPESLVELMRVEGLGPKRAKALYQELGVRTVDDVERVIADGSLESLAGFGAKVISNLQGGIARYRKHRERLLLAEALPLAVGIAEALRQVPGVGAAEPAGSVRRMKETVGDVDILVSSDDPSLVMEAVRQLPQASRIIASGDTKASIVTPAGVQVDVRAVQPSEWGAALVYFTGSKEHNVALRERAKQAGLKVNEYGVFSVSGAGAVGSESGEVRLGGSSEDEVYKLLGMDVPPPELREGVGEVEAASARDLPRLLELSDVRGDLQSHSTYTDGATSLEGNRSRAAELGYEYIAATDHAYELRMVGGLSEKDLERQWAEIDEINARGDGPHIFKSIELNIGDKGELDYPDELLVRFDLCLASMHSGWEQSGAVVTQRLLAAIENPWVDIIAHPTGRVLGRRDPMDFDAEEVFAAAGENGTAMEINCFPDRLDLSDTLIMAARRHRVRFSLGTDAHAATQMSYMHYGVATARRGWVTPEEVLNCLPKDKLLGSLKRARTLGSAWGSSRD